MRTTILTATILLLAGGAAAQTPDQVFIEIPDGGGASSSSELKGTLSAGDLTCTWSFGPGSVICSRRRSFDSPTFVQGIGIPTA